ncbi:MAG TPA: hypothetical protein PLD84_12975, partial [Chitinophagales bacterium]|nr:hypothetical protein [Chitinophagales bacterium]
VGDEAFFASLNKYLTDHRFGTGEVHQLRLAFEAVTGQDLNWFFNQWYLSKGHPVLDISYAYDAVKKEETVTIYQLQDTYDGTPVFRLPLNIDVYEGGKKTRYARIVTEANQEFTFSCATMPDLVNVEADKVLVCEKTDNKSDTAFAFQLDHAPLFMDRLEALYFFSENTLSPFYEQVMLRGMNDRSPAIRLASLEGVRLIDVEDAGGLLKKKITALAMADSSSLVRATAMEKMAGWNDPAVTTILENGLRDSSYTVISTALQAMVEVDSVKAYTAAQVLERDSADEVLRGLTAVYARMAGPEKNNFFLRQLDGTDLSYNTTVSYGQYLSRWPENKEVVESALPLLYNISEKNPAWYVRLAATNSLENLYSAMDERKETYTNKLVQDELSADDKRSLTSAIEWLDHQMKAIAQKVGAIKAAETNENLKLMYGLK